ncbi:MAG: NUDIX domain-containing protein [Nitrososphaerales archaeon]
MSSGKLSSKGNDASGKDPVPAVDLIVRKGYQILLEQRGRPPFENRHCLPGGHVEYGETVESAALRELKEETTLDAKLLSILGVYSDPNRDPRGQRISTVFIADWVSGNPVGRDDAKTAKWYDVSEIRKLLPDLAFDHSKILNDYFSWSETRKDTFWSSKKR